MANTRDLIGEQETLDGLINHTLTSIEEDGIDSLTNYALAYNTALTSVNFPNVTSVGQNAFLHCAKLTTAVINSATSLGAYAFANCDALTGLEIPATVSSIQANCFVASYAMTWLKLLRTSKVTLNNVGAFSNTLVAIGLGAIYVPSNLVATYKADSKWKNFFIASLDDYPLTDFSTIKDSWPDILAAEANGTYSTKYAIGDTKKAVINGNDVYMQIVAFDADTLTGGGTAKITWIAKHIVELHAMNNKSDNTNGWAASSMRSWLRDTVYAGLDSDLKNAIKEVNKTYYDKTSNTEKTVSDTLWIPSYRETNGSAQLESNGPIYSETYTDNPSRMKYLLTSPSSKEWWLRTTSSSSNAGFMCVSTGGAQTSYAASSVYGVAFGFCT